MLAGMPAGVTVTSVIMDRKVCKQILLRSEDESRLWSQSPFNLCVEDCESLCVCDLSVDKYWQTQICVLLPASLSKAPTGCNLSLELWGGGALLSCCTALLLPSTCAPILGELRHWLAAAPRQQAQQVQQQQQALLPSDSDTLPTGSTLPAGVWEELYAFVGDLGEWMQFAAKAASKVAQCGGAAAAAAGVLAGSKGAVGQLPRAKCRRQAVTPPVTPEASAGTLEKDPARVELILLVGKDLLYHAVRCGMVSLAGTGRGRVLLLCWAVHTMA